MELAPSTLAQWVGALATSAAVIVALFKDEYLRYFRRPKLAVRIVDKPPDCLLSPIEVRNSNTGQMLWTGKCYWLRLWIQNDGAGRAEQVQVFVSKLYKRDANGNPAPVAGFIPMNLRWSNSRDPKNPEIFAAGISRRPLGKHCDLCSISDPANPTDNLDGYTGQCVASLQLEVYPSTNSHRLPPGNYIMEVIVGAANANPITTYVQLNLTGKWSPNQELMFREYVGVAIVSGPPIPE
jgi:hypothetical protein